MKGITKGNWYYEVQILMFMFLWKHDMSHKSTSTSGFRLGRLVIEYDSAWLHHGFGVRVARFWSDLTKNVDKFDRPRTKLKVVKINARSMWRRYIFNRNQKRVFRNTFFRSLIAFLWLSYYGFRISRSRSEVNDFTMHRFWWKEKVINDAPDIDFVDGTVYTMRAGHSEKVATL